MTSILKVEDLHVWIGSEGQSAHIVRGVSFDLAAGERMALVGESGSGKSTTVLALMGLLSASATVSGRVLLDGDDVLAAGERSVAPHRWRDIAMVFQGSMNALNPVITVGKQIREAVEWHAEVDRRGAKRLAEELLESVALAKSSYSSYPHELSGGMKQRACIAMALACDPRVLLADEPTTALDVIVQEEILRLLVDLCDERGLALVLVTHDLPIVSRACQRASVMYAGRIIEEGGVETLYRAPRHPYTAALYQAIPDLALGRTGEPISGRPPTVYDDLTGCAYANRCPHRYDRCVQQAPPLYPVTAGHAAACHLNDRDEVGVGALTPSPQSPRLWARRWTVRGRER